MQIPNIMVNLSTLFWKLTLFSQYIVRRIAIVFFITSAIASAILYSLWLDYQQTVYKETDEYIQALLHREMEPKKRAIEQLFDTVYQNSRTISLLPSMQAVKGKNRANAADDVVANNRISSDAFYTVQQIYNNIVSHVRVSEIYAVLDGLDYKKGEIPFFTFDELIFQKNFKANSSESQDSLDSPLEFEDQEYEFFPKQIAQLKKNYPRFNYTNIDSIPAVFSPLMRTCDNTQYQSLKHGNERETYGLLYSVPFYSEDSQNLSGIVSVIIRANILEAALLGIPNLPLSEQEKAEAVEHGYPLPEQASNFLLQDSKYGIRIQDRRNTELPKQLARKDLEGRNVFSTQLNVHGDTQWTLHYYIPEAVLQEHLIVIKADYRRKAIISLLAMGFVFALCVFFIRNHYNMRRVAHYDFLTGLPNRLLFQDRLQQTLAIAKRESLQAAVLFIDLDEFKPINDTYGHQVGDILLKEAAMRMVKCVRRSDTVSRLGGDEFVVLLTSVSAEADATTVAEKIRRVISEPFNIQNKVLQISTSIGVAIYPQHGEDEVELMNSSDIAMYVAKKSGRNNVQTYAQGMEDQKS